MGAEWIEHKGKRILYNQYAGLCSAERLDLICQGTKMIVEANSMQVLTLTNISNCYLHQDFVDLSKKQGTILLP